MSLEKPEILFRRGVPLPPGAPRTVIVLGAARGGTTMIARMLHDLGVFMGERLGSTFQDDVMNRVSRALFHGRLDIDDPGIERILRERDERFAVWGWKFPAHVFDTLYEKARNPHLIVVFRDPVAIATRESVSHGYSFEACFARALEQIAELGRFAASTPHPCLCVSYERGMAAKTELADALADFAGIDPSGEARERAAAQAQAASRDYLRETSGPEIEGRIDAVDSRIAGWLRYVHRRDRKVSFTLLVDDVPIYEGVADRFRADLGKAFGNDGCCSFEIAAPDHLSDGGRHKVSIRVANEPSYFVDNNDAYWPIGRA